MAGLVTVVVWNIYIKVETLDKLGYTPYWYLKYLNHIAAEHSETI